MSTLKQFIDLIDNIPLNTKFKANFVYQRLIPNRLVFTNNRIDAYLLKMLLAGFIEVDHKEQNSFSLALGYNNIFDTVYIKKHQIPNANKINMNIFNKLAYNQQFRINYMRKHKLTQLRNANP
jgi:hypothetical protein